jgi:hypothetical protein
MSPRDLLLLSLAFITDSSSILLSWYISLEFPPFMQDLILFKKRILQHTASKNTSLVIGIFSLNLLIFYLIKLPYDIHVSLHELKCIVHVSGILLYYLYEIFTMIPLLNLTSNTTLWRGKTTKTIVWTRKTSKTTLWRDKMTKTTDYWPWQLQKILLVYNKNSVNDKFI